MQVLLDTNAFLYGVRDPMKLSRPAAELMTDRVNELIVPAAVPWELAIKLHSGRLPEAEPILTDYTAVLVRLGASSLSMSHVHTIRAGLWSGDHRDPFDRLFAAIAISEGLPLISRDTIFDQLPDVRRIW
jgi:PIN domain nuclease of toxin-antitoxin system